MLKKGEAESPPAPRLADGDRPDPSHPIALLVADENGGDLVAVLDREPERRVGLRGLEPPRGPVLERLPVMIPLLGEAFLECRVESPRLRFVEGRRPQPARPFRGRGGSSSSIPIR